MRRSLSAGLALGVALPLAPAAAMAQSVDVPRALTLDAAVRRALERNPTLAAAAEAVDASRGVRLDATRLPNPAVTYESEGYPLFASPRPRFWDAQGLTLRVDQEIELAGRRGLRTAAAVAGVAAAEAGLRDARRRLALDVQRAYFDVVLAKANLDVARTSLNDIDQVIMINRARFDQGSISGVELRRLQVERLRFVDDVFSTELGLRNAKSTLLALMNAPDLAIDFDVTEPLAPPSTAPAPPGEAALAQAVAMRADLAAVRRRAEGADAEARLQRALRTPNITVGAGYYRDHGANAVVVGVTVPLQLFNRNQGGVMRAEAEQRRAEHLAEAAAAAVRLDVQRALNAVDASNARVAYIEREYLDEARRARDTVQASYRLGAADLIDYLDAQRGYRDTIRTYNEALYAERLSLFQLAAAIGAPLDAN